MYGRAMTKNEYLKRQASMKVAGLLKPFSRTKMPKRKVYRPKTLRSKVKKGVAVLAIAATLTGVYKAVNTPETVTLDNGTKIERSVDGDKIKNARRKLENLDNRNPFRPPPNGNKILFPTIQDEKAKLKACIQYWNGEVNRDEIDKAIEKQRYNIARQNIIKLNKELEEYNNIDSIKELNKLDKFEKHAVIEKIIAKKIELLTCALYENKGGFSKQEEQKAKTLLKKYKEMSNKNDIVIILNNINSALDALQVIPQGSVAMPVKVGLAASSKGFVRFATREVEGYATKKLSKEIGEKTAKRLRVKISRQLSKKFSQRLESFFNTSAIKKIERDFSKEVLEVSKEIDRTAIFRSKNNVVLWQGNKNVGWDHIRLRHFPGTSKYRKIGSDTVKSVKKGPPLFSSKLKPREFFEDIKRAVEKYPVKRDARHEAEEKAFIEFDLNKYGMKTVRVIISDPKIAENGKLTGGRIVTAFVKK